MRGHSHPHSSPEHLGRRPARDYSERGDSGSGHGNPFTSSGLQSNMQHLSNAAPPLPLHTSIPLPPTDNPLVLGGSLLCVGKPIPNFINYAGQRRRIQGGGRKTLLIAVCFYSLRGSRNRPPLHLARNHHIGVPAILLRQIFLKYFFRQCFELFVGSAGRPSLGLKPLKSS